MEEAKKWETCLNALKEEEGEIIAKASCPHSYMKDGIIHVDRESCGTCKHWRGWSEVSERTVHRIRVKDCLYCGYAMATKQDEQRTCNYIEITGTRRPCKPGDCREAGIFIPKQKRKRTWRMKGQEI